MFHFYFSHYTWQVSLKYHKEKKKKLTQVLTLGEALDHGLYQIWTHMMRQSQGMGPYSGQACGLKCYPILVKPAA